VIVELAMCMPVFLMLLFFVFNLAYDEFVQAVLDSTLALTAQQVEVGNTTGATSSNFVTNDVCANDVGLLSCGNMFVRVETYAPAECSDFYTATTGLPPISNGQIGLSDYVGTVAGTGGNLGPTACSTSGTTAFCDPLPAQQIIMSAVYLTPTFLQGLLPGGGYTYNGKLYHVTFATIAFETENFEVIGSEASPCPASA